MNMNDVFVATLIEDLKVLTKVAPRSTRRGFGIAFAAKRGIDILEREDTIDDAIATINECIDDDCFWIHKAVCIKDESYYEGRLSMDEDILGSLESIKDIHNMAWMMTGIPIGNKDHHRVKMWCVGAEDKHRIEEAGNKIVCLHETYVNIKFLPW